MALRTRTNRFVIDLLQRIFFAVVNPTSPPEQSTIRKLLETAVIVVIVACACWNIWIFGTNSLHLGPRDTEDVTEHEREYEPVREILKKRGYPRGTPVDMITNRSLRGAPAVFEDDGRWAHAQYVMVPWILRRDGRAAVGVPVDGDPAPFVVADFWDGQPEKLPEDLIRLYEGPRISLFERRRR